MWGGRVATACSTKTIARDSGASHDATRVAARPLAYSCAGLLPRVMCSPHQPLNAVVSVASALYRNISALLLP